MRTREREPLVDRFWKYVQKSEECWLWTGGKTPHGYGVFSLRGGKKTVASRMAWEITHGQPVPEGIYVCHRCDNPPCVNPDHLFLGTHIDNAMDMVQKSRSAAHQHPETKARGEQVPGSKMTPDTVVEMRRLYEAGGITTYQLADRFGITQRRVWLIVKRRAWQHIA